MSCYRRILVAVDGSPDAAAALERAATLARDQNALITLLMVAPGPAGAPPVGEGLEPVDYYAKIMREATDSLPEDVGVRTRIEHGDPATTILELASSEDHDLIVMGSHGHGRIHRALLGSVSEGVLRKSAVPLMLMRAAQADAA